MCNGHFGYNCLLRRSVDTLSEYLNFVGDMQVFGISMNVLILEYDEFQTTQTLSNNIKGRRPLFD
jgi:hypothetical protein